MRQSLYRKYRPTNFDEVVGQKVIIKTLINAIKNDNLSHAYLFAGPRGTGKTSIAKILAKMVNCENLQGYLPCNKCVNCTQYNNKQAIDIIEIDAASNNGVEEIRELKSKIDLVPSIGKYKIYIIDEVHMLSTGAFNALLKTLEEPPKHVIFILATTDPHKVPLTILSRCQRFDFKRISTDEIHNKLKEVAKKENINIDDESLEEIAILSDGGMRDALSLLDQAYSYNSEQIKINDIHEINGTLTPSQLNNFFNAIISEDINSIFKQIDKFNTDGKDFYKLTEEIINYLRNILIYKTVPNYFEDESKNYNVSIDIEKLLEYIKLFNNALYEMKNNSNMKLIFEITIISLFKENSNKSDNKFKEIRINNTLCNFDKKSYLSFKEDFNLLKNIDNDEYKDKISFILNGEIKAYSNNYFIIVFNNDSDVDEFNSNYKKFDEMLLELFNEKLRGIAVNTNEWNNIKQEFNTGSKKYKYIEEER